MAIYQMNDTDGDSVFLIETDAPPHTVQTAWNAHYYKEWESADELQDWICDELRIKGHIAERVFITEINPK